MAQERKSAAMERRAAWGNAHARVSRACGCARMSFLSSLCADAPQEALDRTAADLAQREEVEARDAGNDAVATVTEAVADAWRFCAHAQPLR